MTDRLADEIFLFAMLELYLCGLARASQLERGIQTHRAANIFFTLYFVRSAEALEGFVIPFCISCTTRLWASGHRAKRGASVISKVETDFGAVSYGISKALMGD